MNQTFLVNVFPAIKAKVKDLSKMIIFTAAKKIRPSPILKEGKVSRPRQYDIEVFQEYELKLLYFQKLKAEVFRLTSLIRSKYVISATG